MPIPREDLERTWDKAPSARRYAQRQGYDLTGEGLNVDWCPRRKGFAFLPIASDEQAEAEAEAIPARAGKPAKAKKAKAALEPAAAEPAPEPAPEPEVPSTDGEPGPDELDGLSAAMYQRLVETGAISEAPAPAAEEPASQPEPAPAEEPAEEGPADPDHANPAYWEHLAEVAEQAGDRRQAAECREEARLARRQIKSAARQPAEEPARQPGDRVFEDHDGWHCIVSGRVFGAWATKALAAAGMEVEQHRARTAPTTETHETEGETDVTKDQVWLQIGIPYDLSAGRMWAGQIAKKFDVPVWICAANNEVRERIKPGKAAKATKAAARAAGPAKERASTGGARSEATERMIKYMRAEGGRTLEQIGKHGGWENKPSKFHLQRWADSRGFKLVISGSGPTARYHAKFPAGR